MAQEKEFSLGIIVGRFQTFHTGHQEVFRKAIALCGRVGVFIGSSQESGTFMNPFTYKTREKIIRTVFGDQVSIFPLPDIGVGNNSRWGDYVIRNVQERFGQAPDLLISGKETRRIDWFDSVEGLRVAELYIPKTIEISASQMRGFFAEDDEASYRKYTDPRLWEMYPSLRQAVLDSQHELHTDSI